MKHFIYYHLTIDSSVKPVVHPPRKIPLSIKGKVEAELQRLTDLGAALLQQGHPIAYTGRQRDCRECCYDSKGMI